MLSTKTADRDEFLQIFVAAGIFTREQRGTWAYYRLVCDTSARWPHS
jgi:hypothetical protein